MHLSVSSWKHSVMLAPGKSRCESMTLTASSVTETILTSCGLESCLPQESQTREGSMLRLSQPHRWGDQSSVDTTCRWLIVQQENWVTKIHVYWVMERAHSICPALCRLTSASIYSVCHTWAVAIIILSNVPLKRRGSFLDFQSDTRSGHTGIVQEARGKWANLNFWTSQDTYHLQECSVVEWASFNGMEATYEHGLLWGEMGWGSTERVRVKDQKLNDIWFLYSSTQFWGVTW